MKPMPILIIPGPTITDNNVPDDTVRPYPSCSEAYIHLFPATTVVDDGDAFIHHPFVGVLYTLDNFLYPAHVSFGGYIVNSGLSFVMLFMIIVQPILAAT